MKIFETAHLVVNLSEKPTAHIRYMTEMTIIAISAVVLLKASQRQISVKKIRKLCKNTV